MKLPDFIKKILTVPYFYRAEVTHQTIVITSNRTLQMAKYKASSISFMVPPSSGAILYDIVKIKSIPLNPGDAMLSFNSGVPNYDKTKYEIVFDGLAGTQPVLYCFISSVNKYIAVQPSEIEPCKE